MRVSPFKILIFTILLSKVSSSPLQSDQKSTSTKNLTISAKVHVFILELMGKHEILESSAAKSSYLKSDSAEDGGFFVTPKNFRQGDIREFAELKSTRSYTRPRHPQVIKYHWLLNKIKEAPRTIKTLIKLFIKKLFRVCIFVSIPKN